MVIWSWPLDFLENLLLRISLRKRHHRQGELCWWSVRFVTQVLRYIPQKASTTLIWSISSYKALFFSQTNFFLSHSFSHSSYHSLSLKTCCHPTFSGIDMTTTVLKYSCFFFGVTCKLLIPSCTSKGNNVRSCSKFTAGYWFSILGYFLTCVKNF